MLPFQIASKNIRFTRRNVAKITDAVQYTYKRNFLSKEALVKFDRLSKKIG